MSHPDKELAAIILRTLVTTPKTVDREWMPIYEFLAHPNHFDLGFPGMFDTDLEWLTTQEWLPTSNISPGNKREILRSVEEFEGLDEHVKHVLLTCKARAFVKRDNDKVGFQARTIQGMEPIITAFTGAFVAELQHRAEVSLSDKILFAAGRTVEDLAKWRAAVPADFVTYALDMVNWDSNLKAHAIRAALQFYKRCLTRGQHPYKRYLRIILQFQKLSMAGKRSGFRTS